MAHLTRSAKPGSDWSAYELLAYNIVISPLPPDEFFPTPDQSLDDIDPTILNSPPDDTTPTTPRKYLAYLELATSAAQRSFIYNFAAHTLILLDFEERYYVVARRFAIPLTICGEGSL